MDAHRMGASKDERRIQREAERRIAERREKADSEARRLVAIRSQPVEDFRRRPGENLDRLKNAHGDYYTGDEAFDRLAREQNRLRPKPEQFRDVYPKEKLVADMAKVERFKKSPGYQEERGPEAIASEYVVNELIKRGVFGKEAKAQLTADTDDYFNHVDLAVTVQEEGGEPMFLGVDVTTKDDVQDHRRKLGQTVEELKHNRLNKMEYYSNPGLPEVKGEVELPRIVIDIQRDRVKDLQSSLTRSEKFSIPTEVQHEMLEEAILQVSQSTAFLLTEHYRAGEQIELAGNEPEQVIEFFHQHGLIIKRQNPKLYDNVMKHVKLLGYLLVQEKEKGPATRDDVQGGSLWKLVHEGKVY